RGCRFWYHSQLCSALMPRSVLAAARGKARKQRPSRQAAFESLPDLLLRQLAADEDDAAFTRLALLPRPLVITVEDHVHALEHESLVIVLERQNALAAQDARSILLHEVLHPRKELVRIEWLVGVERHRMHLLVMIVFQTAAIVVMMTVTI